VAENGKGGGLEGLSDLLRFEVYDANGIFPGGSYQQVITAARAVEPTIRLKVELAELLSGGKAEPDQLGLRPSVFKAGNLIRRYKGEGSAYGAHDPPGEMEISPLLEIVSERRIGMSDDAVSVVRRELEVKKPHRLAAHEGLKVFEILPEG